MEYFNWRVHIKLLKKIWKVWCNCDFLEDCTDFNDNASRHLHSAVNVCLSKPSSHLTPWPHNGKNEKQSHYIPRTPLLSHCGMCLHVYMCMNAIHNTLHLPFDLSQGVFVEQRNTHFWYQDAETSKDWVEITLLQTFHNAAQLNCNSAWLFGSLFTPTTLLQSHTSNYLCAGVSTYGYDSFRLTMAINRGVRDQNCSSESVTDDRYGKRFSMIFCTHGGGGSRDAEGKKGE